MTSRYRSSFGRLRGAAGERFYEGPRPTLPAKATPPAVPPGAPPKPPTTDTTQART
jgi:hypothetical protein